MNKLGPITMNMQKHENNDKENYKCLMKVKKCTSFVTSFSGELILKFVIIF